MTTKASPDNKVFGKCTFSRGIHPPHRKMTEASEVVEIVPKASQVYVVPMSQHIGAPCKPCVEKGQEVQPGQKVGDTDAFVSSPVHSPVKGVVKDVIDAPHPSGRRVMSVIIVAAEDQPANPDWRNLPAGFNIDKYDPQAIITAVRAAGIVGQGGAAFPTHVKLTPNPKKPIDTIIINGCECEPYLTSDHRLMLEGAAAIVGGLELAVKAAGAKEGIIAVEDNKPDAIDVLFRIIRDKANIKLAVCKTKYPQGGEKQLISAVLNRAVPTGGLPLDVGVVVINAGTASAITYACAENRSLIRRIVTVTGKGIKNQGNFLVPVGMLLEDLLAYCGGFTDDVSKVLLGGPMMGPTTSRQDIPVLKGFSGITVLSNEEFKMVHETACIRCSRCVDACPMNLIPTKIAHAIKARDVQMALDWDLLSCMECGCCSYVCPSWIPLLQYLRSGKVLAREVQNKK